MIGIYVSIVLLVIYGDLLKRYLPPQVSSWVLYAVAIAILIGITMVRKEYKLSVPLDKEGIAVNRLVIFLIALYVLQLITDFSSPFMPALIHAGYMCIPLLYIVVVQTYCPQFDLERLGRLFLWLMIPVNCVGLVQYFINPTFLVSTVYSGDLGGVVLRNLLQGGVFARFPSIFASADRYSAMGLMQLYFLFVVLSRSMRLSWRTFVWMAFNFLAAFTALLIAGARSRILIAATVLILVAITFFCGRLFSSRQKRLRNAVGKALPLFVIVLIMDYLFLGIGQKDWQERIEAFSVLTFLQQSFVEGDISGRAEEAAISSFIPEEVTLWGEGLGTVGAGGKPGEFGIRSMWIESGLIWGSLLLLTFMGIVLVFSTLTYKAFFLMQPIRVAIYSMPLLQLIFALLAGLTAGFELSSGILLSSSIAVITRSSSNVKGPSVGYSGKNI